MNLASEQALHFERKKEGAARERELRGVPLARDFPRYPPGRECAYRLWRIYHNGPCLEDWSFLSWWILPASKLFISSEKQREPWENARSAELRGVPLARDFSRYPPRGECAHRLWRNTWSVLSPDEILRRELKIQRAAKYFWRTSRCCIWWWNTVSNAWYYFSDKMILKREIKDAKMSSSSY